MTCSIRKKCAGSQIPQSKEKSMSMLDVAQTGRRWSQNTHTERYTSFFHAIIEFLIQYSMDWFKGKSTGNHGFYHQI